MLSFNLDPLFSDYWSAFIELKGSAGCGWAPEPVTPSDVLAWCEINDVAQWRRPIMWRMIHHLDSVCRQEGPKR